AGTPTPRGCWPTPAPTGPLAPTPTAAATLSVAKIGCRSSFRAPGLGYNSNMDPARIKPKLPLLVFFSLMAISLGAFLLLPPISQDQSYHQFADQRTILGIPNFWNVVSNLPFLAVGAAGLRRFRNDPATVVFFLGVFLTGIGSSYYHWNPNDETL